MDLKPHLNNARLCLIVVFLVSIMAILIFDFWAWATHGRDATASSLINAWAHDWPLLPFLMGMMMAHLFWG